MSRDFDELKALFLEILSGDPAVLQNQESALADRLATKLAARLGGLREPYRTGRRGFDRLRETLIRQNIKPSKNK